jgi:hypothetical protein
MSEQVKILSEAAAKLQPEDRIALIEAIQAGLLPADPGVEAAWTGKANERRAAYLRGETKTVGLD